MAALATVRFQHRRRRLFDLHEQQIDDAPAKAAVVELFDAAGFFPIDLGDLVTGGRMPQLGGRCRRTTCR